MIQIFPISPERWNDFVSLMKTDAECLECFCLNHRERSGCPTGSSAQLKMKALSDLGKFHGLLAYEDSECIGWIAVDPMEGLIGHDCQPSAKDREWAIHCVFVKEGFRGLGISTQLVQAAIKYAKSRGASVISAFPIPDENRTRFPSHEAEFSGRFSTFVKFGFKPIPSVSDFYQRMELE